MDPARRQRLVRTLVVLGGFGVVFFLGRTALHAARARHEKVVLASVHKCLFGRPFDPGEHPAGRLHRISLFNPPNDWPDRCDRYLGDLAETRDDLDESTGPYTPDHVVLDDVEARPADFDAFWEFSAPRPDVDAPPDVIAAPSSAAIGDDTTPGIAGELVKESVGPRSFSLTDGRVCETSDALDAWSCQPGTLGKAELAADPATVDVDSMLKNAPDGDRPAGSKDDVRVIAHDGKLLVAWRSAKHGIRFRIGSAAELSTAPDFVAYDDRMDGGDPVASSRVTWFGVFAQTEAALLVVQTSSGLVKLFRIAPNGPITTIAPK